MNRYLQNLYCSFFCIVLCISVSAKVFSQELPSGKKSKKGSSIQVKPTPYYSEYPIFPQPIKIEEPIEGKAWIVYSDRNGNNTYADEKLHTPLQKIHLLDSFYINDETRDALQLIRCVPGLVQKGSLLVTDPGKIEIVGWVEKSKIMLSEKSHVEQANLRPIKSLTMLGGTGVFEKIRTNTEGNLIKVYDGPESNVTIKKELGFDEIVYVYKKTTTRSLIGRQASFNSKNINDVIIGWVMNDFVQSWGQRLCAEETKLQKEKRRVLYLSKDTAIRNLSGTASGFELEEEGCDKRSMFQRIPPLLSSETLNKGKEKIKVVRTAAILNIFDKSKSYVYNVNGSKIDYNDLCNLLEKSKNINVVFALNPGADTKDYMFVLNKSLQELSGFFMNRSEQYNFRFGATDSSPLSSHLQTKLMDQYSDLLPEMISIIRKSVEDPAVISSSSIVFGLANAAEMLKGKDDEINIIVMISSQADNTTSESMTKNLREPVLNSLAKIHARMLFMQPYCGTNPAYANFVTQAKVLIKGSSDKNAASRKNKLVGNIPEDVNQNNFRSIMKGPNNIYCLDFPENANNQGLLIFPTIGNKIEERNFVNALDTLITQVKYDNDALINAISKVFNSPSSFNNKVNLSFKKYYAKIETLPEDVSYYLKNIDYHYFLPGYVAYPQNSPFPPLKQTLLLSAEEYEELYSVFKGFQFEHITSQYEMKDRSNCYQAMLKIIRRYSDERRTHLMEYSSFSQYFYEIAGYKTENKLLQKYKVADLIATNSSIREEMKTLSDHVNTRFNLFYAIKHNPELSFFSNGTKYYWVNEDFLP